MIHYNKFKTIFIHLTTKLFYLCNESYLNSSIYYLNNVLEKEEEESLRKAWSQSQWNFKKG